LGVDTRQWDCNKLPLAAAAAAAEAAEASSFTMH